MSSDPKEPPDPPRELFPYDEMSTGETSSLLRRANALTGAPDAPVVKDPTLKPMTGAQLAFRPSAPPRTGTQPALKPKTGPQPAHKPGTGSQPAFKPSAKTDVQHAFVPPGSKAVAQPAFVPQEPPPPPRPPGSRTGAFAALPPREEPPAPAPEPAEEEHPVFDAEKLQRQIRTLSLTDSALGRSRQAARPAPKAAASAGPEDTFTKKKMRQAEINMPDFDLDEDLG